MDIFTICVLSSALPLIVYISSSLIYNQITQKGTKTSQRLIVFSSLLLWALCILTGLAINTEDEISFVQNFLEEKEQIETQLNNPYTSEQERLVLKEMALEKNREFQERKEKSNAWYVVLLDTTIYDGVELIEIGEN